MAGDSFMPKILRVIRYAGLLLLLLDAKGATSGNAWRTKKIAKVSAVENLKNWTLDAWSRNHRLQWDSPQKPDYREPTVFLGWAYCILQREPTTHGCVCSTVFFREHTVSLRWAWSIECMMMMNSVSTRLLPKLQDENSTRGPLRRRRVLLPLTTLLSLQSCVPCKDRAF